MLYWSITFFLLSVFSAILGFMVLAGIFALLAKISFIAFLIGAFLSLVFYMTAKPNSDQQ